MQAAGKLSRFAALLPALLFPSLIYAQHYTQTNLVSDLASAAPANDLRLKNAWGLSRSTGSPWWVSDNGTGLSTLYNITGTTSTLAATINPRVVVIPPPNGSSSPSTPTGTVFNGSHDFALAPNLPALFIFVTEDGTISGWNPNVDPAHPNNAILEVDNSPNAAVYKGVTTGDVNGVRYLYAANFRSGHIEVYDTNFKPVRLSHDSGANTDGGSGHQGSSYEGSFQDDEIPQGYAPFNVQNIGGSLFVAYAKQDSARHDDVAGESFGFVDIFSTSGDLERRLEHGPWFNSPWGVVWTPRDFGEFSNRVLVGNFGSGQIAAFNGFTGKFIGLMKNPDDTTLTIDGLWALAFGNSANAGPYNALFFSAGPNGEADGLFGALTAVGSEQDGDEE
jgi:uncharacterized protein (TIGR03118 family)